MGVRFISINDHYDSLDYKETTGGLDVVMKNIVYDYYSKDLSMKVKTAKYQKMKQGKYLGGHVPYGLMKNPKDKHKLIVDPEEAAVVREIFDMAIAKMRIIDMARTLNERGVETPGQYYRSKHPGTKKFINSSDKACWTHANLRTILKQEMYYGAIVGHKRQGIGVGCKHTVSVPKEEQFIVEGRHIAELEQKFKDAETMKDDSLSQALSVMKKYSGADELTQAMVQELIDKVVVTDPEHVEIVWRFKDDVRKFIGI